MEMKAEKTIVLTLTENEARCIYNILAEVAADYGGVKKFSEPVKDFCKNLANVLDRAQIK